MNLLLTILFGVVGLGLSYGFFIPPELSMFRLIAVVGVMVGYRVGQVVVRLVRPPPKRFLSLIVGAVLCVCVCRHGSNGISQYIRYSELGCATWLVFPLAGIFIALHTRSCSEQNRDYVVKG
jgi:hypothetical protein